MTDRTEWTGKVGNVWADEWQRTDRSFGQLTDRLLEIAQNEEFTRAVDIGCGAGEVTLRLAQANESAEIVGLDISEDLVSIARERTSSQPNVRIELGDAAHWRAADRERPDCIVSRHGVMFFDDPVAAFAHVLSEVAPGARMTFSCFRDRADNVWVKELAGALPPTSEPPADPEAPGPFAFGKRERVVRILGDAGWSDIDFDAIDYSMIAGRGSDAVDDALSYFLRIGPAARAVASLEGAERRAAIASLRTMLERFCKDEAVALPAACWIVTARAPA
ncbi:class I SAM-dependent methyltransferase [Qipengyuania qiaonensis]|uniref:Class I SAM-dependent methyltransferase n=1 Tax=Qipengyuania qiaonensis TaxID=2867240 RepID=A0ABS7J5N3_9SPHN|nr:class I SAM-dependent methyltransferase [Qipengyuania qiaonensis]MBX7480928.1 class I SAM-dependent methyltransferase [Qipengyuania qiaonensis]